VPELLDVVAAELVVVLDVTVEAEPPVPVVAPLGAGPRGARPQA